MTPHAHLLKVIEEMRAARKAAFFKGKLRFDGTDLICDASSGVPDSVRVVASPSETCIFMDEDALFFAKAANEIDGILDALKIVTDALKRECCCPGEMKWTPPYDPILCDGCEALEAAAKATGWKG